MGQNVSLNAEQMAMIPQYESMLSGYSGFYNIGAGGANGMYFSSKVPSSLVTSFLSKLNESTPYGKGTSGTPALTQAQANAQILTDAKTDMIADWSNKRVEAGLLPVSSDVNKYITQPQTSSGTSLKTVGILAGLTGVMGLAVATSPIGISTIAGLGIDNKVNAIKTAITGGKYAGVGGAIAGLAIGSLALNKIGGNNMGTDSGLPGLYQGLDYALGGYLPGGISVEQQNQLQLSGGAVKSWSTGTAQFSLLQNGKIAVQKKNGQIKIYSPYRPLVFGKKVDAAKFSRLAKKYRGTYSELHRLFGRKK